VSIGTILLIILILLLVGAIPTSGFGAGPYVTSPLAVVVVILIILLVMGRL
jgi:hypothetical protein